MRVTPQVIKANIALGAGSQHFTQYQKDWLSLLKLLLMVLWKIVSCLKELEEEGSLPTQIQSLTPFRAGEETPEWHPHCTHTHHAHSQIFKKMEKMGWGCTWMVECLPSLHEALDSILRTV